MALLNPKRTELVASATEATWLGLYQVAADICDEIAEMDEAERTEDK